MVMVFRLKHKNATTSIMTYPSGAPEVTLSFY